MQGPDCAVGFMLDLLDPFALGIVVVLSHQHTVFAVAFDWEGEDKASEFIRQIAIINNIDPLLFVIEVFYNRQRRHSYWAI